MLGFGIPIFKLVALLKWDFRTDFFYKYSLVILPHSASGWTVQTSGVIKKKQS